MAEQSSLWDSVIWLAANVGLSLALLTGLLIIIAYLLLLDRKVWAAVQLRARVPTSSDRGACCNRSRT